MELVQEAGHAKENSPTVRRKLVFEGLSLKQSMDAQGSLPGPPKVKKDAKAKRRALGDISNSFATDLGSTLFEAAGKGQRFQTPVDASAPRKASTAPAVDGASPARVSADDDIELAHGGVSTNDDVYYMKGLHDQLDAQVQAWKDEAAKEAAQKKAAELLALEASFDTTLDTLPDPESMWRSTPPTPEEIYLDDSCNGLFDTEGILDFTLLDA
ncbi:hypothetical protein SDRG_01875 [Saprolegnia diclina VS20]|uniref:Uncharacterized protein n=1 Tax=Saprolegnia diclina (strain VS20) TaxID=1156394 RepID=T0SD23_SAPDV|nr:hypothetical protein SDRG_01875 [Saprolegnia diclina VS20]EQC40807.1 hypothetical protein SDRG_01875 [Saprolegnia diclina VS20]|eukprot:XP_008605651.1 hypothetical protein SDRG_01875 [Saprolegnia diclina VS20]